MMQKQAAQKLVQETLQGSFDKERFVYLVKNILNHVEEDHKRPYTGSYIFADYRDSIQSLDRVGKYQGPDEKLIDILIVHLAKDTSLDRARTKQRNFVAKYLKGSRGGVLKDAALVAFVAPNGEDWRFSLVKMDYKFNENGRVEEKFTPARRYSFLVGKNENSHTAQSRLLPILLNDEANPMLEELEEVFSVERVTKEFFEKYRDLFLRIKESLDAVVKKDTKVRANFKEKNIDTADFAKKLLGQIVFLYFLQKKGWFGVERDKKWGSGSKHFLRELFEKKHGNYKNFFNDILEPLFYEALRLERPGDYYSPFNCRIPFLNGGLFDPIGDYDWWNTDILLPNDIFSNDRKTKDGDTGDGILDIFDRYNFTVKEDEPLEKEVAVDPEMLGRVFENLLEVKDRRSKGTYYTPREIVHYMCQESLANYLATELEGKTNKEKIETLIKYGEAVVEHDSRVASKGRETDRYSFKLPASVRKHAKLIDEKLATIRVCDPAVGSGAFPVGMMNEIIRTRNALTAYIGENGDRSPYHFKRHAIQNCLYGVDIDPGAVEICKLRLWLSLVVDEESRETVQPLPNLDYKIMQGNSLVELVSYSTTNYQQRNQIVNEMKKLKDELFNITSPEAKKKKRNEIEALIKQLFEYDREKQIESLKQKIQAIKSQGRLFEDKRAQKDDENKIKALEAKIQEIKNIKVPGPEDHFEWHINFSEVFQEKGGFDVVMANPPYVRISGISEDEDRWIRSTYKTVFGHYDLYIPFMERGISLLNNGGTLSYITPNKYLIKRYANKLRPFILANCQLIKLIDTSQAKTFDSASVYPIITILTNKTSQQKVYVAILDDKSFEQFFRGVYEGGYSLNQADFNKNKNYTFDISIQPDSLELFSKILVDAKPVGDYARTLTGTPAIEKFYKWKTLLFPEDKLSKGKKALKFINVSNVSRYKIEWGKRIRSSGLKLEKPYIVFDDDLIGKNKWSVFEKRKIVIKGTAKKLTAAYDDVGYANVSLYAVVFNSDHNNKTRTFYHLALLNSELINFWYCKKFASANLAGNYISFNGVYLEQIPIKEATIKQQKSLADLVDKILAITKDEDYLENPDKQAKVRDYEKQIDQLVYKLYNLMPEEIKIIKNSNNK